jgi:hypothetical protein
MADAVVKAEIKQNVIVKTTTAIGVPPGGTIGQILKKLTSEDYSTEWANEAAGVTTFIGLTDTPSSYSSQSDKVVKVNNGETALEYSIIRIDSSGRISTGSEQTIRHITTGTPGIYLGVGADTPGASSGAVVIGNTAGAASNGASGLTAIGYSSATRVTSGNYNTMVGYQCGGWTTTGTQNSYYGYLTGWLTTGSRNVFLGAWSGRWQTAVSDMFIINNQDRTNAAGDLSDSLLVGQFDASPANQWFQINGNLYLTQVKSGATQVAAGASAGEVWADSSNSYALHLGI